MGIEIISIIVTIVLALLGYWITKRHELELTRRKERLELINKMINEFYGPMYVATRAGAIAHKALTDKIGTSALFVNNKVPQESILQEWRVWVTSVFLPLNQIREDIIMRNAHLVRETEMPECLLNFVVHASAYKATLAKWEKGDFSEYLPIVGFPTEISEYITNAYCQLKEEQAKLIGSM